MLRKKREALEKTVFSAFKSTQNHSKSYIGHNIYPFREPTDNDDTMGSHGISSPYFNKTEVTNVLPLLGACPRSHISYGDAVSRLQVGDYVDAMLLCSEVEGVAKKWTACIVQDIQADQNIMTRNVKVAPLGSLTSGSAQWIAVEDSRLAPLHSHTISSTHLEMLKRRAEQNKIDRSFHETLVSELASEDLKKKCYSMMYSCMNLLTVLTI